MANIVSGKLPPPAGMTYESFSEYALYLTLREFLRLYQGQQAMIQLDASYAQGSRINGDALLAHPMGKIIAALGRAMHEGAVLPGWNNQTGVMNWSQYSGFVRWFARLNRGQQTIAIARMRAGSEAPWKNPQPEPYAPAAASALESAANPSVPGGIVGLVAANSTDSIKYEEQQAGDLAKPDEGIGTAGWIAIIAAVVSIGMILYKVLSKKPAPAPEAS